jgi:FSIP1 family
MQNNASEATKDDLAGVDPQMKEAILKMRKLDRILLRKMEKEKKVKRDRILLQRR